MSKDVLAQEIIHGLAEAVQRGGRALGAVPGLLRRLIDENLWQERNADSELVHFNKTEFRAFVEAPYPIGLSTTLETLEALCGHEPRVMDFIAQAKQGKPGRPIGSTNEGKRRVNARGDVVEETHHNMMNKSSIHPESVAGTFNRLRSEAYEIDKSTGEIRGVKNEQVRQLYEDVLQGRKAPNRAAIEAGFRSPKVAVRLDDMQSAAQTLVRRLSAEQLDELIAALVDCRGAS